MRKLKILLTVLLTALLLAGGACLPGIVGAVQDQRVLGQPRYEPVQSVRLQIRDEMSVVGKLSLMKYMYNVLDISGDQTRMTEEDAAAAGAKALAVYYEVGLIQPFDVTFVEWAPVLICDPKDPEVYGIFWKGLLVRDEEPYPMIEVYLDDETGRLMYIQYIAGEMIYEDGELEALLNVVADIYFAGLEMPEYESCRASEHDSEKTLNGITYTIEDKKYGNVYVECFSFGSGFYLGFP